MTPEEWGNSTDPRPMLQFLRGTRKLTARKARWFAVACCRRCWGAVGDERSQRAVEVAERYAEGLADERELRSARRRAVAVWKTLIGGLPADVACIAETAARADRSLLRDVGVVSYVSAEVGVHYGFRWRGRYDHERIKRAEERRRAAEHAWQSGVLRCVVGNPSGPPSAPEASLLSRDGVIARLAEAAYGERVMPGATLDPARLAVLCDALEEAGCTDAELLGHLRSPGPHVRGCFALDAVLGKA